MAMYTLLRLLFLAFNSSAFSGLPTSGIFLAFVIGWRFDIVAITIINLPIIAIHLLPESIFMRKRVTWIASALFYLLNIPFLLANCVDLGLFRFSARRLTADIFSILELGDDFVNTVPKMLTDFWPEVLVFVIIIYLLQFGHRKWALVLLPKAKNPFQLPRYLLTIFSIIACSTVSFRGGLQYKPITVLTAAHYVDGAATSLILNSSFTIIKTYGKEPIKPVHYFDKAVTDLLAPVIHTADVDSSFIRKNIVIIILEGIGKEYSGYLNHQTGYTPFLDSLMQHSLVFTQAYANGKRSIEGIPAVVAGIPSLMDQPFITSPYAGNKINTLASLLKAEGYSSIFLHGGTNGTMGFDGFSLVAGYDRYFGRTEYANDADFDGTWGIYDFPFLQRSVDEFSRMPTPFIGTIFTLSSHHPYAVPAPYDHQFPEGALPIHKSVRYADESLRAFFAKAAKQPWFKQTLFVITSDHTALAASRYYQSRAGIYSIPMIYYTPGDSLVGISVKTTQQIDILPSVLGYLHFPHSYFAIGRNVFDSSTASGAINFLHGSHQLIDQGYSYVLDTIDHPLLFDLTKDTLQQSDISKTEIILSRSMDQRIKALIQQYNNCMLENKMTATAPRTP